MNNRNAVMKKITLSADRFPIELSAEAVSESVGGIVVSTEGKELRFTVGLEGGLGRATLLIVGMSWRERGKEPMSPGRRSPGSGIRLQ